MTSVPPSETREYQRIREAAYREKLKNDPERLARRRSNERKWRAANPDKNTKYSRDKIATWREHRPWMITFRAARRRARKFNMAFALTKEWVCEEFAKGSALSGLPFRGDFGPFSPSIDRIDSAVGYTPQNSRLILLAENLFKNEWDDASIIEIAKAIAERNA